MNYCGINIELDRDERLSEQSLKLLTNYYLIEGETSPQHGFARAAVAYSGGDLELAQRIYNYVSKGWFMFSSPILSNAPAPGEAHKGLPISCFLSYVPDTIEGITQHHEETAWLSVKGGGVGGHWDDVRGITEKSPGVMPMLKVSDAQMTAFKQGKTRKGSYAAYLDVDHPDIVEFINFKTPTGGDTNRKCFNLFNAVNVTDKFMNAVIEDQSWDLIQPNNGEIVETINARELWQRILEARFRTGSPYVNFIDTANEALPEFQKELDLTIHGSNLCNEIHLATDKERTAVCCLSSVNLELVDDWIHEGMIGDLVEFLDNVLTAFIEAAPDEMEKAAFSALRERSIGIGAMGFAGLLMKKGYAWGSEKATYLNEIIFDNMNRQAKQRTEELAMSVGPCPDFVQGSKEGDTPVRNAHLFAIAPNANSSILCNCTASIEPLKANIYTHRTRVGADVIKNPYLEVVLKQRGLNTEEVWSSIMQNDGSVQHLEELDQSTKDVFKTSFEINQLYVVQHAAERQPYICQGQSVNLFFPAGTQKAEVHQVHLAAWQQGLKGLYYLRTTAGRTADKVGQKVERVALQGAQVSIVYGKEGCPFCVKAKEHLDELGLDYEYIDLDEIGKTAAEVTGRDVTTVPQIYIKGEYIGGYEDLVEMPEDDDECTSCQG
jgi:ribonucleoside-diphosphate reductase alpha chain